MKDQHLEKEICTICNQKSIYYSSYFNGYDAKYCKNCNIWLESSCDHAECEFCKDRPKHPKDIKTK